MNELSNTKQLKTKVDCLDDLFDLELSYDCNLQLPNPSLVQYYRDEAERKIYIVKDIGEDLLEQEKLILRWNSQDEKNHIPVDKRKCINIYIYSYGGDGNACMSFIDVLKLITTPCKVICMGVAMSAAAMIFISAPKGNRYMLKHSTILVHQGSSAAAGEAQVVLAQAEDYKHFLDQMKDIVLENTNITKQMYTKMQKKEWYIYSDKAVELGVADYIVDNISQII